MFDVENLKKILRGIYCTTFGRILHIETVEPLGTYFDYRFVFKCKIATYQLTFLFFHQGEVQSGTALQYRVENRSRFRDGCSSTCSCW